MSMPPPPGRERMFNVPGVVIGIVVVLLAIHAWREWIPIEDNIEVLSRFAFVPGRFTFSVDPDRVSDALNALMKSNEDQGTVARFFLGDGEPLWWTPLTYAFLHGDWTHVGLNALWLVAFGAAVARRFGPLRFLVFSAVTAVAGAGAHFITHMNDLQPVIGASATVSGAMGAAVRFAFQPRAPSFFAQSEAGHERPLALTLAQVMTDRRALSFLAVWFATNLMFGIAAAPLGITESTVAWEAHVGGFLVGLLGFSLFDPPVPPPPLFADPPPS